MGKPASGGSPSDLGLRCACMTLALLHVLERRQLLQALCISPRAL